MDNGTGLLELFTGLRQTDSLEAALLDALQLACAGAKCPAGAVTRDDDAIPRVECRFRYDPENLLSAFDSCQPAGRAVTLRRVQVPLRFDRQSVGHLLLLVPDETSEEEVRVGIAPFDTVLATLIAATVATTSRADGLLSRQAFAAHVASEIARVRRYEESFSVVHLTIRPAHRYLADKLANHWSPALMVGEALISRLRKCDVVGVMAPHRVAVLLAATGPLGARIAKRRIEQMFSDLDDPTANSKLDGMAAECWLRSFPDDGSDADALCAFTESGSDKTVPALAMGVQ